MAFAINTNVASLQAQNSLRLTGDFQSKTINRVTSGLRIVCIGRRRSRSGHCQYLPFRRSSADAGRPQRKRRTQPIADG